jgi:hypothetical protein
MEYYRVTVINELGTFQSKWTPMGTEEEIEKGASVITNISVNIGALNRMSFETPKNGTMFFSKNILDKSIIRVQLEKFDEDPPDEELLEFDS